MGHIAMSAISPTAGQHTATTQQTAQKQPGDLNLSHMWHDWKITIYSNWRQKGGEHQDPWFSTF